MKVIDLLNKIANKEEVPKSFEYLDFVYIWNEKRKAYFDDTSGICFSSNHLIDFCLNDEVKIIDEDKKIEKLFVGGYDTISDTTLANKINEIIDVVNKLKEEE